MGKNQDIELKSLEYWIKDYWNEWVFKSIDIGMLIVGADLVNSSILRDKPVRSFLEYIEHCNYEMILSDLELIPSDFLLNTDRLVRTYNELICEDEIDLLKLERIVCFVRREIYEF